MARGKSERGARAGPAGPSSSGRLARGRPVVAPDGIAVYPVPLGDGALVSLAVGRIPPGEFAVHFHYALEQVTCVLSGQVTVRTAPPDGSEPSVRQLGPGEAIATPGGHLLSFANRQADEAEVLFICVPPYPDDDSDTGLPGSYRALTADELGRALKQHRAAAAALAGAFEARARGLEHLLARLERP